MASDNSIFKKRLRLTIKWFLYTLVLVAAHVVGQNADLFEFSGVRPVLILPVAICVAMFEHEFPGGLFAAAAGILWGLSSDAVFGYYAILLLVLGVTAGLICSYVLRPTLLTSLLLCGLGSLFVALFDFFFFYVIWSYDGLMMFFTACMLPTVAITAVSVVPCFLVVRFISRKLQPPK